jgi:selenocysteine lyase/cysteine desulfurase
VIQEQSEPVEKSDWDVFREEMPVARQWAYFDHAAVAPLSGPAQRAIAHWNEDAAANGDAHYQGWMRQLNDARQRAAQLIHAQPEEIALVPNTTAGIGLVAEGYPGKRGITPSCPTTSSPRTSTPG